MPSVKDPAIKEVLPAGTLEAFASNRRLREQLEEVRSSVTHAKAQVDAAGSISSSQVPPGCPSYHVKALPAQAPAMSCSSLS